jgi:hypothetical protein
VGGPPAGTALADAAAAFDPLRRKILVWGGRQAGGQAESAALWQWDVDGQRWSALATEGTAPHARYGHLLVHDPRRQSFFLYGGRSSALLDGSDRPGALGDGWELTVAQLAAGERCQAAHADRCASGRCVDDRCCPSIGPCGAAVAPDAAAPPGDAAAPVDAAMPAPDAGTIDDPHARPPAFDAAVAPPPVDVSVTADVAAGGAQLYSAPGCSTGRRPGGAAAPLLLLFLAARVARRGKRRVIQRPRANHVGGVLVRLLTRG